METRVIYNQGFRYQFMYFKVNMNLTDGTKIGIKHKNGFVRVYAENGEYLGIARPVH